jgi:hypothetical protein
MKNIILLSLLLLSGVLSLSAKSLKGAKLDFVCQDTVFKQPFIDIDEIHTKPVRYRYIHGGFADGTRFSFYFPEKAKYKGHFFQYITPFPDSETSAQAGVGSNNFINFSVSHGAYFIETNEGGRLTFTPGEKRREASIGAYRANAACAQLSRYIAHLIYDCPRPYGYAFGGSGGAYRTTGAAESTTGVWDGFVPFILGSPQAIPNVFAVRMYALRVLKDVLPKIVDALEPGGSGNPYEGLTVEQAQVLQEATRMGFPIKAWYGYKYMDVHGFLVLYNGVVSADPTYFNHDFWNVPGYLGYDAPESLRKARVQKATVVTKILGEDACERLGLVKALSAKDRGTADQAWRSMGSDIKDKPVGYELADNIPEFGMGGDLVILTGKAKGQKLQITKVDGNHIAVASFSDLNILKKLHVGDSVRCDNSDFLAIQTYHRHQVPTPDYYVWDQFRDYQGHPIYPQRPMLLGPIFTRSAAGCLPTGKIHGKMILCCSVWDREAFAWQGDWYRKKVQDHLGNQTDQNFRLWYTDRCTHGDVDDSTEVVSYSGVLQQALLDVADWVEKGIEPPMTTNYQVKEGQVVLAEKANDRHGIQPVPVATIDGKKRADVHQGDEVTIHVVAEAPVGKITAAKWSFDGCHYTRRQDLRHATYSEDGRKVDFDTKVSFSKPGTYFAAVKVTAQRDGDAKTIFTDINNIDRVRIVVK